MEEYILNPFSCKLLTAIEQGGKNFNELVDKLAGEVAGPISYPQFKEVVSLQLEEYVHTGIIKQTEIDPSAKIN